MLYQEHNTSFDHPGDVLLTKLQVDRIINKFYRIWGYYYVHVAIKEDIIEIVLPTITQVIIRYIPWKAEY